jgi:proline racemase
MEGRMKIRKSVTVIGAHAEGEVGNVLVGGIVDVPGKTAFEKMEFFRDKEDSLRRSVLFEPRGSVCHAVNVLLPTSNPSADLAFVIMEATKYPAMSGSNTMCVATVVLETGIRQMREPETRLVLEAPGGLIEARCVCRDGKVLSVTLSMLPSFVLRRDLTIEVPGFGVVHADICYGGIFYAIVPAATLDIPLAAISAREIVSAGIAIRDAVNKQFYAIHPENPKIRGVANVILTGPVTTNASSGIKETISATVIGNGRLDRSPCGTGVASRMALLLAEGAITQGASMVHRSVFDTAFSAKIVGTQQVGEYQAVVPEVSGRAWITSQSQVYIDPSDPLSEGHCPNDVWLSAG